MSEEIGVLQERNEELLINSDIPAAVNAFEVLPTIHKSEGEAFVDGKVEYP